MKARLFRSRMSNSPGTGAMVGPAVLLVVVFSFSGCLLSGAQLYHQQFNPLDQHRTPGAEQQMTSSSSSSSSSTAPTEEQATPTQATINTKSGHSIERRHASNDHDDHQSRSLLLLLSSDDQIAPAGSSSSTSRSSNGSDQIGQTTNNKTTNQTEVSELNALEAASLGYFRHSLTTSVILTIAYTIVFIVGIIGNSFVVAIVCKSPRMRTVTNYFIANLALADILVLLFCLPATLVGNLFIPYVLGLFVCKTVSYLQGVAVSASINTMVTVTLDRFLAICFPMDWHMSRRMARWTIACIWLFSMSVSLPWALFFALVPYPLPDNRIIQVCAEDWPSERWGSMYFVCANLILLYLFPATVIILCYLGIWYKIERRNIPGDRPKGLKIELIMQKSKLKVVKMMMVVVVIFLLSWLPLYLIFARIKLVEERSAWEEWLISRMMPLAQWLGASNSCINPILYTFFNRKYKRGFIDLLKLSFCCCLPGCARRRASSGQNQDQPLQHRGITDGYSNGMPSTNCTTMANGRPGGVAVRSAPSCTGCRHHTRQPTTEVTDQNVSENGRSNSRCCRQQPNMRMDFILPAVSSRRLNQSGAKSRLLHCSVPHSKVIPVAASTTTNNGVISGGANNQRPRSGRRAPSNVTGRHETDTSLGGPVIKARDPDESRGPQEFMEECRGRRRNSGDLQQQQQQQQQLAAGTEACSHKGLPLADCSKPKVSCVSSHRGGESGPTRRSSHELSGREQATSDKPATLADKEPNSELRASASHSRQPPDRQNKLKCASGQREPKYQIDSSPGGRELSSGRSVGEAQRKPAPPNGAKQQQQQPNESARRAMSSMWARVQSKQEKEKTKGKIKKCPESESKQTKRKKRLLCRRAEARDRSLISSARELTTESTDVTAVSLSTTVTCNSGLREPSSTTDEGKTVRDNQAADGDQFECKLEEGGLCGDASGVQDNLGQEARNRRQNDIRDEISVTSLSLEGASSRTTSDEGHDDNDNQDDQDDDEGCTNEDEEEGEDNLLFGSASSEEGDNNITIGRRHEKRRSSGGHIGQGLAASGNSFVSLIMNGLSSSARSDMTICADPRRHSSETAAAAAATTEKESAAMVANCAPGRGLDCKTSIMIKDCGSSMRTLTSSDKGASKQTDYNV